MSSCAFRIIFLVLFLCCLYSLSSRRPLFTLILFLSLTFIILLSSLVIQGFCLDFFRESVCSGKFFSYSPLKMLWNFLKLKLGSVSLYTGLQLTCFRSVRNFFWLAWLYTRIFGLGVLGIFDGYSIIAKHGKWSDMSE